MAAYGDFRVFDATIASGTTTSAEIDLGGYSYEHVYVQIPASPTGNTDIYASRSKGGTYVAIANQSGVKKSLASSVSNCMARLPDHGRFMKVVCTTAPTADTAYYLICYS